LIIGQPVLQFNHTALLKYRMTLKMLLGSMHPSARTARITKLDRIALAKLRILMAEVTAAYDNFEFYKGVNAINKWISSDLSAFYLEAMKDRLYCGDGGGVVEELFHGLLRMLTPVTPMLVEEAWNHRPEWMKAESQVHPFHRTLDDPIISPDRAVRDDSLLADLPWLLSANTAIKTAQEEARAEKIIGSSLESSVVLQLPSQARDVFERYADELETIFVVSSVALDGKAEGAWKYSCDFDTSIGKGTAWVLPPNDHKCPRCWRYLAPVEDGLCKRCEELVSVS
jgi:isoleucyl-tRNA synthetase